MKKKLQKNDVCILITLSNDLLRKNWIMLPKSHEQFMKFTNIFCRFGCEICGCDIYFFPDAQSSKTPKLLAFYSFFFVPTFDGGEKWWSTCLADHQLRHHNQQSTCLCVRGGVCGGVWNLMLYAVVCNQLCNMHTRDGNSGKD